MKRALGEVLWWFVLLICSIFPPLAVPITMLKHNSPDENALMMESALRNFFIMAPGIVLLLIASLFSPLGVEILTLAPWYGYVSWLLVNLVLFLIGKQVYESSMRKWNLP